ncbi:CDP-diacylglycerol--glycerol-3-phosphate 3-phosphatidyltransferase 2-like isoform X2 [Phoenix dactylifera]|uniref:CDP-diacylglycerol--glycerol-3-phosphate 3-phosphatidyltransferase 2-like isoform X2 n=1 Tax=Phoenix dactylifera TaxID=42345 RepID=A0A8B9ARB0_PHODC|nr:CDP-diacylglycerol--glycerol-3-phosphate 3-phosphatidyltransferase 2-like isoform X2 [Phoenix dactylifera]
MPPPLPASLLKAVAPFPAPRHHPPSLTYGKRQRKRPLPLVPRSPGFVRPNAGAIINRSSATRRRLFVALSGRGGIGAAPRSAGQGGWWWMRSGSGRATLAAGEGSLGARKWTAGGTYGGNGGEGKVTQGNVMSSLHQHPIDGREVGSNGGYRQEGQQGSPRLLTLPTVLTIGRVAAVPLLVSTFYMNGWWATTATTCIFIAAAVTDWLDGYIARKMHLGTPFGAFLDPVADKLMVAATLVLLCTRPLEVAAFGEVPWLLTVPSIAIIGREITMSAVREWAASQNSKVLEAVAVNNLGKWKTATQMTALTILLATRDSSLTGPGVLVASGIVLLYVSAGLAVWSLAVYMRKIWRVLLK